MVNEFDVDQDLAATNPVRETSVAAILPPDVNDFVLKQVTESHRGAWRPRGINLARVGFLGVLASIGLVLLGLNFGSGAEVTEVTPAIRATPAELPETTTTTVLTVGPATTLAVSVAPETSTTSTTDQDVTATTVPSMPSDTGAPSEDNDVGAGLAGDQTESSGAGGPSGVEEPDSAAVPLEEVEPVDVVSDDDDGVATEDLPDDEEPCLAIGDTRRDAIDAFKVACDSPRVDCDPIGNHWLCSSEQIGDWSP